MVKEYKVILCMDTVELEKKVNEHLRKGWKLQGGVSIWQMHAFAQALARYLDEIEHEDT